MSPGGGGAKLTIWGDMSGVGVKENLLYTQGRIFLPFPRMHSDLKLIFSSNYLSNYFSFKLEITFQVSKVTKKFQNGLEF